MYRKYQIALSKGLNDTEIDHRLKLYMKEIKKVYIEKENKPSGITRMKRAGRREIGCVQIIDDNPDMNVQ